MAKAMRFHTWVATLSFHTSLRCRATLSRAAQDDKDEKMGLRKQNTAAKADL